MVFGQSTMISATADQTLVVLLAPQCGACRASADFFRQLAGQAGKVHIAVGAPEPLSELEAFLDQHGIAVDARHTFSDPQVLRALGTVPSFSLVGRDGIVQRRWHGLLGPEQQKEVLSSLR